MELSDGTRGDKTHLIVRWSTGEVAGCTVAIPSLGTCAHNGAGEMI